MCTRTWDALNGVIEEQKAHLGSAVQAVLKVGFGAAYVMRVSADERATRPSAGRS
jgi:hypothetical protein